MKSILYVCLIGILVCVKTPAVFAQKTSQPIFVKGSWQIGLQDSYGASPIIGNRNTAQLAVGYYVINRLQVGLVSSYTRELAEVVTNRNLFSAGPLLHYQFTSSWLSPYAEVSYQFGRTSLERSFSFTPGLSLGLIPRLRIDLSYRFQYINWGYNNFLGERYCQPQLGVNYLFATRR